MAKKKTQGGTRKGAGAKLKYGEPTVMVSGDRVPKSKVKEFKDYKINFLNSLIKS